MILKARNSPACADLMRAGGAVPACDEPVNAKLVHMRSRASASARCLHRYSLSQRAERFRSHIATAPPFRTNGDQAMPGPFRRKARAASTIHTPVVGGAIRCSDRVVSGLVVSITAVVAVMIPDLWWPRAAAKAQSRLRWTSTCERERSPAF